MFEGLARLHFDLTPVKIANLLEQEKFDVVIIIDTEEYLHAVNQSNHKGSVIVEVHTSIEKNLQYLSNIERSDIDAIIVVSQYIKNRVQNLTYQKLVDVPVIIFPNVVDSDIFYPVDVEPNGVPVVGWVGKLDDHKNWRDFLKICSQIKSVQNEIEFWIIGGETSTESRKNEFLKYADKLDLLYNLKWFDRIENDKMRLIYSTISKRKGLCLVTSKAESFGMSIIESLLCGCPVIATNVGAIPEINSKTDTLKLYNYGDLSNAVNLSMEMLGNHEQVIDKLLQDRNGLVQSYSSQKNSRDYYLLMENLIQNNGVDYGKLVSKLSKSTLIFDKIFDYDSIIKPQNHQPPEFKFTDKFGRKPKVCSIMDEFSYNSFKDYFDLINISSKDWQNELLSHKPDFFFLESAWKGHNYQWEHKINRTDDELLKLLTFCREKNIPTVFWNKEDPVHFNTFLSTAIQCDYVFTTDVDCISNYKSILGHNRVYLLPFAANPNIHNPIKKFDRKQGASFAGAYYKKYKTRNENFSSIVNAIESVIDLDIFDRFFNEQDERYAFPDDFQQYIRGNLPYTEIDKAYKGYDYGINLNTIKQSQSMFARRVYELMASNTAIISNFSRGLRTNFGDLIISSDNQSRVKSELIEFKPMLRLKKYIALRKLLSENTYGHRVKYMLSKICINYEFENKSKRILFICSVRDNSEIKEILKNVNRQKNIDSEVIFVAENIENINVHGILDRKYLIDNIEEKIKGFDYFIEIDLDDYLAENCIYDMTLVKEYFDFDIVTKLNYFIFEDGRIKTTSEHLSSDYELVSKINPHCSLFTNNIETVNFFKSLENIDKSKFISTNLNVLSIPEFDYVRCKDKNPVFSNIVKKFDSNDYLINTGLPLTEILSESEEITSDEMYNQGENKLNFDWFFNNISVERVQNIDFEMQENSLMVTSELSTLEHKYLYSKIYLERNQLLDGNESIFFEISPGLDIMIVAFYFDDSKAKLSSQVLNANTNHELDIPKKCVYIQFSLRIRGGGSCEIKQLLLEKKNVAPQKIFTANKNLVLTDNYPSYENLYRNQFIHSRVQGYKSNQVGFDVFVLKTNTGIEYREFQNVDVMQGSTDALLNLVKVNGYENIFVHFLNKEMWETISNLPTSVSIFIWAHGAEIQPYERRKFNYNTSSEHKQAKKISKERMKFWKNVFSSLTNNMKMVFVSNYFSSEVFSDIGITLEKQQYRVIHNPIDTDRFSYTTKDTSQRFKILSIRTFASRKYANDISVKVILELSKHPQFEKMEILICGDGELFDEITQPLHEFSNVTLKRGFLSNEEYEDIFNDYGIFLTPTRWDSHGVSRDEAMSAGLVPVTNSVSAIPEFVDDSCAVLGPNEDYLSLAEGIIKMIDDENLFFEKSLNASIRVRSQSSSHKIIKKELGLIEGLRE